MEKPFNSKMSSHYNITEFIASILYFYRMSFYRNCYAALDLLLSNANFEEFCGIYEWKTEFQRLTIGISCGDVCFREVG